MGILYRGVTSEFDDKNGGKLCPKGNESSVTLKIGDNDLKIDGSWDIGSSEKNTVRAHQLESGRHNGCFISTSRSKDIAYEFATINGSVEGYIYEIDIDKLIKYGVVAHEPFHEDNSHEVEVSIRAVDNGNLPDGIIIKKSKVTPREL